MSTFVYTRGMNHVVHGVWSLSSKKLLTGFFSRSLSMPEKTKYSLFEIRQSSPKFLFKVENLYS